MAKQPTHLRFLLALGNTRIIALQDEENLRVYSSKKSSNAKRNSVQAEHISEALVAK